MDLVLPFETGPGNCEHFCRILEVVVVMPCKGVPYFYIFGAKEADDFDVLISGRDLLIFQQEFCESTEVLKCLEGLSGIPVHFKGR